MTLKAYKQEDIENLEALEEAKHWFINGWIDKDLFTALCEKLASPFYTPNIWIRLGLFLCTFLGAFAVAGLLGISFLSTIIGDTIGINILCIIVGAAAFLLLENFVLNHHHYKAGTDNALLYIFLSCCAIIFTLSFQAVDRTTPYSLLVFCYLILSCLGAYRYSDSFLSVLSYILLLTFFFFLLGKNTVTALSLPFIGAGVSAFLYLKIKKIRNDEKANYFHRPLMVLEMATALGFYLSLNYYVVDNLGSELGLPVLPLVLKIIFLAFTFLIPPYFIYRSLQQKDRLLLWSGMIVLALAVFTYKNYFSAMALEYALLLGGAFLLALAYLSIRYFSETKNGISSEKAASNAESSLLNAEAIMIANSFAGKAHMKATDTIEPGGGHFGGAGASDKY